MKKAEYYWLCITVHLTLNIRRESQNDRPQGAACQKDWCPMESKRFSRWAWCWWFSVQLLGWYGVAPIKILLPALLSLGMFCSCDDAKFSFNCCQSCL